MVCPRASYFILVLFSALYWFNPEKTGKYHDILFYCPQYELHRKQLYDCINDLCPNLKDLKDDGQFNYLF